MGDTRIEPETILGIADKHIINAIRFKAVTSEAGLHQGESSKPGARREAS
jgi:hypothetical protein